MSNQIFIRQILALAVPAILFGCPPEDEYLCTDEGRSSVNVEILDTDGNLLTADSVTFRVNGGPEQEAECWTDPCTDWVAGWEQAGEITVIATVGDETQTSTVNVGMTKDGCHVKSEFMTFEFDDGECINETPAIIPSVLVSITDPAGIALSATSVIYRVDGGPEKSASCNDDDCTEWTAGFDTDGVFTISATYFEETTDPNCWFEDTATDGVTVTNGECSLDTQLLNIALDPDLMICI